MLSLPSDAILKDLYSLFAFQPLVASTRFGIAGETSNPFIKYTKKIGKSQGIAGAVSCPPLYFLIIVRLYHHFGIISEFWDNPVICPPCSENVLLYNLGIVP